MNALVGPTDSDSCIAQPKRSVAVAFVTQNAATKGAHITKTVHRPTATYKHNEVAAILRRRGASESLEPLVLVVDLDLFFLPEGGQVERHRHLFDGPALNPSGSL